MSEPVPAAPSKRPRSDRLAVTIPTKNRPQKLARCLAALERAREQQPFVAWVGDSSDDAGKAEEVATICAAYSWVRLRTHGGRNVAAARNFCAKVAEADLLVNVDDDIQLEPQAVRALLEVYENGSGPRVVGGSVCWDGWWSRPMRIRPFGYARWAKVGETPDFLNGALFLYPRAFALQWPWNGSIRVADDIFMSAVWRGAGIQLLWATEGRAVHDPEHVVYGPGDQDSTIYANLFLALIAVPDYPRALAFEVLGFLSGLKAFGPRCDEVATFLRAWARGHRALARDRHYLAELVLRPPPAVPGAPDTATRAIY